MPRYEPFDWYRSPLYYDIIFDSESSQEADFLEAVHERYGLSRGRRCLEPACGTGRLIAEMARRGYEVTGFDASPFMLRFARKRLQRARLRAHLTHAWMESFSLDRRYDLMHCLVNTFGYILNEDAARAHLQLAAAALVPGGIYVLGLHLTDYMDRRKQRERWTASRNGMNVVCNIQSWPADRRRRTERVRARLIVRDSSGERYYETQWVLRTYSLRQLKSLLRSVPQLQVVAVFNFTFDMNSPLRLDGEYLDNALILRSPPVAAG